MGKLTLLANLFVTQHQHLARNFTNVVLLRQPIDTYNQTVSTQILNLLSKQIIDSSMS